MGELHHLGAALGLTRGDAALEGGGHGRGQQGLQRLAVAGGIGADDGLMRLTGSLEEADRVKGRVPCLQSGDRGQGDGVEHIGPTGRGLFGTRRGRSRRGLGAGILLGLAADLLAQHIIELEQDDRGNDGEDDDLDLNRRHWQSLTGGRGGAPGATTDD